MDRPINSTRRLTVSEVRIVENRSGTYDISFDLDWREAFRDDEHWNAAWIFLKYNPGQTTEVSSSEEAVATLTHHNAPTTAEASQVASALAHQVGRALARGPGLPLIPPGAPLPPPLAKAREVLSKLPRPPFADRAAEREAEGVPPQQTDEQSQPGKEPTLAPSPTPTSSSTGPTSRSKTTSPSSPRAPRATSPRSRPSRAGNT